MMERTVSRGQHVLDDGIEVHRAATAALPAVVDRM
jgi:hypothetical protein